MRLVKNDFPAVSLTTPSFLLVIHILGNTFQEDFLNHLRGCGRACGFPALPSFPSCR